MLQIRNKKRFFIVLILLSLIAAVLIYFALAHQFYTIEAGYTKQLVHGTIPNSTKPYFKTRNGWEPDGKIIISLGKAPVGRKAVTLKVECVQANRDGTHSIIASSLITEGQTLHLENNGQAGEFFQLSFFNTEIPKNKDSFYTITYQCIPDESEANISRPSAG